MQNKINKRKTTEYKKNSSQQMTFGMKDGKPTLFCSILKQAESRNALETFDDQYNITLRAPYTTIILKQNSRKWSI